MTNEVRFDSTSQAPSSAMNQRHHRPRAAHESKAKPSMPCALPLPPPSPAAANPLKKGSGDHGARIREAESADAHTGKCRSKEISRGSPETQQLSPSERKQEYRWRMWHSKGGMTYAERVYEFARPSRAHLIFHSLKNHDVQMMPVFSIILAYDHDRALCTECRSPISIDEGWFMMVINSSRCCEELQGYCEAWKQLVSNVAEERGIVDSSALSDDIWFNVDFPNIHRCFDLKECDLCDAVYPSAMMKSSELNQINGQCMGKDCLLVGNLERCRACGEWYDAYCNCGADDDEDEDTRDCLSEDGVADDDQASESKRLEQGALYQDSLYTRNVHHPSAYASGSGRT
uniref:Uncharacterized protein n=1 Tax=Lotharella globosa TaxID=91324 RepID=A0A7S3YR99_9EUKA|mmetsp:Transcript_20119/g.40643  ORF Transcript_20119/g.40643 Transcript_20119/m.40643 type:complete len:345 (-) Transcript_20119:718-1752(-)